MICIACKKSMLAVELNQIEIDYCASCKGIWLDRDELEALLGGSQGALDFLQTTLRSSSGKSARKCPICSHAMRLVEFGSGPAVIIDECASDGLWFDRGELEAVIAKASSETASPQVSHFLKTLFQHHPSSSQT